MEKRYPFIRFVIDAAQVIAGAAALIVLLGGTVNSCHHGGFGGFLSFLVTIGVAAIVYVAVMIKIEALRVFLDIESSLRQSRAAPHSSPGGVTGSATP